MKQLTCEDCGPVDHVLVDGDSMLDRLFENIKFKVKPSETGFEVSSANPRHEAYLSNFNLPKFHAIAIDMVKNGEGICPKCQEETVTAEGQEKQPKPTTSGTALAVKVVKAANIMSILSGKGPRFPKLD